MADGKTLEDIAKHHDIEENTEEYEKLKSQYNKGIKVEKKEHTTDKLKASEIAMDHLWEDPKYYDKLEKIEN